MLRGEVVAHLPLQELPVTLEAHAGAGATVLLVGVPISQVHHHRAEHAAHGPHLAGLHPVGLQSLLVRALGPARR
eukprot:CAMPEP_0167782468 /NCGR_PEP_ID=MMETSP0111_2-20121227/6535_1 /TAXON_ID=91324 /ORGANISM="Lotharella globosa, Strain CCCM811" /LENGTH=74 /DNA_ID=CAMNT_0007673305 /DNA_START=240 /DNA_END=460 /DNA_ORIENTATION=-